MMARTREWRNGLILRAGPLLVAAGITLLTVSCGKSGAFVSSCVQDEGIDPAKRQAIDSVALDFAGKLTGSEPTSALTLFTPEFQNATTRGQLDSLEASLIRPMQPKNLALVHSYLAKVPAGSPGRVICAKDITKPDGWVAMSVIGVPEQAHVLLSADSRNNQWAIDVWLVPEQDRWRVRAFWIGLATVGDLDSTALWQMSRSETARGHEFNAALLSSAADQTANRGPNFQLGIGPSIAEYVSHLSFPAEIKGQAPFEWKQGDTAFKVLRVGPISIAGKLYVTIDHEIPPWRADSEADGRNRQLLAYFERRFPEYQSVFAGVVARAHEAGGQRGYGTVDVVSPAK
jgi:hypothetical protein